MRFQGLQALRGLSLTILRSLKFRSGFGQQIRVLLKSFFSFTLFFHLGGLFGFPFRLNAFQCLLRAVLFAGEPHQQDSED